MKPLPICLVFLLACGGPTESPPTSAKTTNHSIKQARLAEKLFGFEQGDADSLTFYDYNDYGNCFPRKDCALDGDCGYRGGHAGWDVQTKSVAGDANTADERFHSLTSGEVTATDEALGMVAVYDAGEDRTTVYLHAREIYASRNQSVEVGDCLGIQGNVGLGYSDKSKAEHVHIEVQEGWSETYSCGASETVERPGIDPINYLYESAVGSQ